MTRILRLLQLTTVSRWIILVVAVQDLIMSSLAAKFQPISFASRILCRQVLCHDNSEGCHPVYLSIPASIFSSRQSGNWRPVISFSTKIGAYFPRSRSFIQRPTSCLSHTRQPASDVLPIAHAQSRTKGIFLASRQVVIFVALNTTNLVF